MKTRRVRINVTQECIDESVCGNPFKCMVAKAINLRLKPGYFVSVGTRRLTVFKETERYYMDNELYETVLSPQVSRKINEYDALGKAETTPFTFLVELPVEALRK